MFGFPKFPGRFGFQHFTRPSAGHRRGPRMGPRPGAYGYTACFKCGDVSHYQYMCPKK